MSIGTIRAYVKPGRLWASPWVRTRVLSDEAAILHARLERRAWIRALPDAPYTQAIGGSAPSLAYDEAELTLGLARLGWADSKIADQLGTTVRVVRRVLKDAGFHRTKGAPQ